MIGIRASSLAESFHAVAAAKAKQSNRQGDYRSI
jgi:hypothetical protein